MVNTQASTQSDVLARFLRYVQVDTQSSDEHSDTVPSTPGQFNLANMLAQELGELGGRDVQVSEHAYATGWIPASEGSENRPRLGLIAHIDTSEMAPGAGVKPHIVHYEGGDLVSGERDGEPVYMSPEMLPALNDLKGEDIVVTDGTTLLGADDKAGVAEIMSLVARIHADPSIPHPEIGVCFCPDEEIGHGASLLDIDSFGCRYAYTVDGGPIGGIEWECFNACDVTVQFRGRTTHPGAGKDVMINATNLFTKYNDLLPHEQRPEHTAGYEGYIHCMGASCTIEHATARYIVRDHSAQKFQDKIDLMQQAADFINAEMGEERVTLTVRQEYRNMAEEVSKYPELITNAKEAYLALGIQPEVEPIRGGTDGAQLSFRGLPCPNISTGGYGAHSVNEFVPVSSLERMVDVLEQLVRRFA